MKDTQGNREHLALHSKGPFRHLLREETAPAHARVDRHFGALIEAGDYGEFLTASASAVLPLEEALTRAGADGLLPDWAERRRGGALHADLAALGITADREADLPLDVGGEAHQFGMLYVLEGSRLGAKVLLADLMTRADPDISGAMHYLRHGAGRRFWPTFLERLEDSSAVARAPQEAVAGAQAAFALFVPHALSVPSAEVIAREVPDGA